MQNLPPLPPLSAPAKSSKNRNPVKIRRFWELARTRKKQRCCAQNSLNRDFLLRPNCHVLLHWKFVGNFWKIVRSKTVRAKSILRANPDRLNHFQQIVAQGSWALEILAYDRKNLFWNNPQRNSSLLSAFSLVRRRELSAWRAPNRPQNAWKKCDFRNFFARTFRNTINWINWQTFGAFWRRSNASDRARVDRSQHSVELDFSHLIFTAAFSKLIYITMLNFIWIRAETSFRRFSILIFTSAWKKEIKIYIFFSFFHFFSTTCFIFDFLVFQRNKND